MRDFFLARFDSSGALDTTFDDDGWLTTSMSPMSPSYDVIDKIALQDDGKILAGGTNFVTGSIALARYNYNGSLDDTFHGDGKVITRFSDGAMGIRYLNVRPSGKLLMGDAVGVNSPS